MMVCVDLLLALLLLEAAGLLVLHRLGRGPAPAIVLPTLFAGFMLVVGLRVALGGGGVAAVGACLLAALPAHLLDLRRRWPA